MEIDILSRLSALAHPQRLALFRLLMRRYPDQVAAGELARALDLKASTLSAYLATLVQAGLLLQTRAGTSLLYSVNLAGVRQTFDHLFLDCCRGRPELCPPISMSSETGPAPRPERPYNVLFLCSGNSVRSILAESLLRQQGGGMFNAYSAGTDPRSAPDPRVLDLLRTSGHDIANLRSKALSTYRHSDAQGFDFVFTVCDRAANEECPTWPGQPISAHWGVPDPLVVSGSEAERALALRQTYGALSRRIAGFVALPIESLDRVSLQHAVDDLARLPDEKVPS